MPISLEYAVLFVPLFFGYGYFVIKIGGYFYYKPYRKTVTDLKTALVIPLYNEDPDLFKQCMESVLNLSWQPEEIYVIDDASANSRCYEIACEYAVRIPRLIVHRFSSNEGKRAIHRWVVVRSNADILVNVDSDVVLSPSALEEATKPFMNPEVQGVSTHTTAINYSVNWLTRYLGTVLISQDFDRASLSAFDSSYVAGRFCLFRIALFRDYMDEYVNERFLGIRLRSGDDACMTRLALRRGRVVYQETSSAQTPVADRLNMFMSQFLRWERNTLRTNLNIIKEMYISRPFWWFVVVDSFMRFVFGPVFTLSMIVTPGIALKSFGVFYLVFLMLMLRGRTSAPNQLMSWFWVVVAPSIKVIQAMIATPIRLYALMTIRRDVWGTR